MSTPSRKNNTNIKRNTTPKLEYRNSSLKSASTTANNQINMKASFDESQSEFVPPMGDPLAAVTQSKKKGFLGIFSRRNKNKVSIKGMKIISASRMQPVGSQYSFDDSVHEGETNTSPTQKKDAFHGMPHLPPGNKKKKNLKVSPGDDDDFYLPEIASLKLDDGKDGWRQQVFKKSDSDVANEITKLLRAEKEQKKNRDTDIERVPRLPTGGSDLDPGLVSSRGKHRRHRGGIDSSASHNPVPDFPDPTNAILSSGSKNHRKKHRGESSKANTVPDFGAPTGMVSTSSNQHRRKKRSGANSGYQSSSENPVPDFGVPTGNVSSRHRKKRDGQLSSKAHSVPEFGAPAGIVSSRKKQRGTSDTNPVPDFGQSSSGIMSAKKMHPAYGRPGLPSAKSNPVPDFGAPTGVVSSRKKHRGMESSKHHAVPDFGVPTGNVSSRKHHRKVDENGVPTIDEAIGLVSSGHGHSRRKHSRSAQQSGAVRSPRPAMDGVVSSSTEAVKRKKKRSPKEQVSDVYVGMV